MPRTAPRLARLLPLLLCLVAGGAAARTLVFRVTLDDTPIGEHRYAIDERDGARAVVSEANFQVKLGFIPVYRYRHVAREQWRGDCLQTLSADTEDAGTKSLVSATLEGAGLRVRSNDEQSALPACVMTFAYWNPLMLRQPRLLNSQTGVYESVRIEALGPQQVSAQGRTVPAERYRLSGLKNPIDLWYSADGQWLALQTTVDGGRSLRYHLQ